MASRSKAAGLMSAGEGARGRRVWELWRRRGRRGSAEARVSAGSGNFGAEKPEEERVSAGSGNYETHISVIFLHVPAARLGARAGAGRLPGISPYMRAPSASRPQTRPLRSSQTRQKPAPRQPLRRQSSQTRRFRAVHPPNLADSRDSSSCRGLGRRSEQQRRELFFAKDLLCRMWARWALGGAQPSGCRRRRARGNHGGGAGRRGHRPGRASAGAAARRQKMTEVCI